MSKQPKHTSQKIRFSLVLKSKKITTELPLSIITLLDTKQLFKRREIVVVMQQYESFTLIFTQICWLTTSLVGEKTS